MEQAGVLRKRFRRNLAKVNGLTNISYNENEDYTNAVKDQQCLNSNTRKSCTLLNLSSSKFADLRKNSGGIVSSRTRVTRNPMFSRNSHKVPDIENGPSKSESATSETRNYNQWKPKPNIDRSHLFEKLTMTRLKQIVFLGMTSGAVPWKWNKNEHRIDAFSPTDKIGWKLFRNIFLVQMCFLVIFQIYTFWQLASSGKFTNREIFITSFSLMWYLEWVDFAINMYMYGDQIREYINTMLKFNNDMVNKYVIHLDDHKEGGRILMKFAIMGDLNAVLIKVVYFMRMPFAPWYLFSYISPQPWYWLIPGVVQEYWYAGQVIFSHTLVYWLMAAHTNTLQFWLTEMHKNYESDYTSDELRKLKTSLEVFKSLQVLNNCFNECVSPLFIPMIKIHTAVVAVVGGYIMIRNMNYLFIQEFPQSLIFPLGFLVCTIESFVVLNLSSGVFDLTCGYIESWSQTKDTDFRKTLVSFPTLKIYVRGFYYITVSTTITFFQVVWDYITDALLTYA